MNQQEKNHDQVWKWDRDHFIHPYTDFSTFQDEGSQVISRGKGMHVFDASGKAYLDAIGGLWCVNIGHGRKEMADAISAQVETMQYYNPFGHCTNEPAAELSARLAELAPGDLNHVFFGSSGSAANDTAIRMVHFYFNMLGQPAKKKIISRLDAYHGSTYLAASLTGIQKTKLSFDCLDNGLIHYVSAANIYRAPVGMDESEFCDYLVDEFETRILQLGPENVAAFIAEPIMGAGGVLVAPRGYHKRMLEVCRKYEMLYIADEVVTSFGRLGEMFASSSLFDIEPDIVCGEIAAIADTLVFRRAASIVEHRGRKGEDRTVVGGGVRGAGGIFEQGGPPVAVGVLDGIAGELDGVRASRGSVRRHAWPPVFRERVVGVARRIDEHQRGPVAVGTRRPQGFVVVFERPDHAAVLGEDGDRLAAVG
jgi:acetylornithine/succinyldiaminopimelate/putrescine aminotransferase